MGITRHQPHAGQFLPMYPAQRFAVHRNGHPFPSGGQPLPGPLGQRRLKGVGVQLAEHGVQRAHRRGRGSSEAHSRHCVRVLLAPPLADGVKAAGAGEHGADGQGQDGGQRMSLALGRAWVGDGAQGGGQAAG